MHSDNHCADSLTICISRRKQNIPFHEIIYLNSHGRQITLHTFAGTYTFYGKLGDVQLRLPRQLFLRCHQSFLVNIDYVSRVGPTLQLSTGDILPVRTRGRTALYVQFYEMSVHRSLDTGFFSAAMTQMEQQWPRP